MSLSLSGRIAKEYSFEEKYIEKTIALLDEGATIPFLARYRKEVTGGLDEMELTKVRDYLERLRALDARRTAILSAMREREQLTVEIEKALMDAVSVSALEDIYLPYRPKRVTRAAKAKERGLLPLAMNILKQGSDTKEYKDLEKMAQGFVNIAKDAAHMVADVESALAGARDILAEHMAEDLKTRKSLRNLFVRNASLHTKVSKGKEEEGVTYKDYFDRKEQAAIMPAHRLLAALRGEREGFLSIKVRPDDAAALSLIERQWLTATVHAGMQEVQQAAKDAWQRLLAPSLENEYRIVLRERAEKEATFVFSANLRKLLLASPLGPKRILALDPGWRTGAKLVCLDAHGNLLHNEVIYPLTGQEQGFKAGETLRKLCAQYAIEAIAIGNGTAGRETEAFVKKLQLPSTIAIILVDERGASVYSASSVAREEFPDQDVTVRGAVSIGRRLMDPLAELVKVTPASLGVGQYQHDVNQTALEEALAEVVASCVNAVGVDMNTASGELLSYVSGIGPALAKNIITWRCEHGAFTTRRDLLQVPRLGPKAFELAAGFLRIPHGKEPLDGSAVHPERYTLVKRMAKDVGCSVTELLQDANARERINLHEYIDENIGLPTLQDIMAELARPGRDPRAPFEVFSFDEEVTAIEHLREGMELQGIVTNVTQFGAFVDLGVHRDGLVHISQLANTFVKNPHDVVSAGQKVRVKVLDVDVARGRINLSMKDIQENKVEQEYYRIV